MKSYQITFIILFIVLAVVSVIIAVAAVHSVRSEMNGLVVVVVTATPTPEFSVGKVIPGFAPTPCVCYIY